MPANAANSPSPNAHRNRAAGVSRRARALTGAALVRAFDASVPVSRRRVQKPMALGHTFVVIALQAKRLDARLFIDGIWPMP